MKFAIPPLPHLSDNRRPTLCGARYEALLVDRPAVLFVKDGQARVVIERESYQDLVRLHGTLD